MIGTEQLKADMAYVRAAAERSETVHVRAYGFLWAVILLFGFSLVDFVNDPRWVNRYWMVASPVGFGLSIWLGRRAHRLAGQLDRQASARWILHWLGYVAAGMLGNVLVISGQLQPAARGPLWVLLLALTYFQAGVHADRRLLPIGLLLAACFLIMVFLPAFGSTVAGVLAAAALVAHALLGAPRRAPPH